MGCSFAKNGPAIPGQVGPSAQTPPENRPPARCWASRPPDRSSGPPGVRSDLPYQPAFHHHPALFAGSPVRQSASLPGQDFAATPVQPEPSAQASALAEAPVTVVVAAQAPSTAPAFATTVSLVPCDAF